MNATNPLYISQRNGNKDISCIKYLAKHVDKCECGICFNPTNNVLMLGLAVLHARYLYITEDDSLDMVFRELVDFWEENRKKKERFPRTDEYYVVSAQMLWYEAHYLWKFKKDWYKALDGLNRALKGLKNVKYGFTVMKYRLETEIKEMGDTIMKREKPVEQTDPKADQLIGGCFVLNQKKWWHSDRLQLKQDSIGQIAPPKSTQKATKARKNPIDMLQDSPTTSTFKIHDDDDVVPATPPKASRSRQKTAASQATQVDPKFGAIPKRTEKAQRNITPSIRIDLSSPADTTNENTSKANKSGGTIPKRTERTRSKVSPCNAVSSIQVDLTSPPDRTHISQTKSTKKK